MNSLDVLFGIIVATSVLGIVCIQMATVRKLADRLTETNERLIVLLGTRDGGEAVGRALVASARSPKKPLPGVAEKQPEPEKPKEGVRIVMGNLT